MRDSGRIRRIILLAADRGRRLVAPCPRFARYPAYALLLGLTLKMGYYFPTPEHLSTAQRLAILFSPFWLLLQDLVFLAGPVLVILLGVVGLAQRGLVAKGASLIGIVLGWDLVLAYSGGGAWQSLCQVASDSWYGLVCLPATMVYELAGQNESLALAMWVGGCIVAYAVLRRPGRRLLRLLLRRQDLGGGCSAATR